MDLDHFIAIEIVNFRFIDDYVYADVYENNNYVGVFGAEVHHIEYTSDISNKLFNAFRSEYLKNFTTKSKLKLEK